jgi:hypothetical protein
MIEERFLDRQSTSRIRTPAAMIASNQTGRNSFIRQSHAERVQEGALKRPAPATGVR